MEDAIKSFELGFLLRSLFAGVFFPISYWFCAHPPPWDQISLTGEDVFSIGLPTALVVGVMVYALHRSLVYPVLEYLLDNRQADHWRFISDQTIDRLKAQYKDLEAARLEAKLTNWGDYAHQNYCAAISTFAGAMAAVLFAKKPDAHWWPLFFAILVFFWAGLVSDVRLRAVREELRK
jgi:hypothetical protein